jgi:hypothetical protein
MPSELESLQTFAKGLIFGNPLYEEVISRGGDPSEVRDALEKAIATEMGEELLLRSIVINTRKQFWRKEQCSGSGAKRPGQSLCGSNTRNRSRPRFIYL